jgi:hypothetical protein
MIVYNATPIRIRRWQTDSYGGIIIRFSVVCKNAGNMLFGVRPLRLNRNRCLYRSVYRCTMYNYPSKIVSVKL